MDYISPKTNYNVNQIGHFKQLVAGAGAKVFKVNDSGVFAGAASYGSAPFKLSYAGALTATGVDITGTIDATGGAITGALYVSGTLTLGSVSGLQVKLKGDTGEIDFLYNNSNVGKILGINSGDLAITADKSLYLTADSDKQVLMLVGAAETGVSVGDVWLRTASSKLYWSSGRYLKDAGSYIECDGAFVATEGLRAKGFTVKPSSTEYSGDSGTFKWMDGATEKTARVRGGIITNLNE
jgi:hypothetical protein